MRVVETARRYVGYLEHEDADLLQIPTANVGKGGFTVFADMIARSYRWRVFQGLEWCAVFVHAVFLEAYGKPEAARLLGKPWPGTRTLAKRFQRSGRYRDKTYQPAPGDIIFLTSCPTGKISHCGIVTAFDGVTVSTIEGNTIDPSGRFPPQEGGAVAAHERPVGDRKIIGYGAVGWRTICHGGI